MEKVIIKNVYQSNEYCEASNCKELEKRLNNELNNCNTCQAYLFHQYLHDNNYSIVKISDNFICECPVCIKLKSK